MEIFIKIFYFNNKKKKKKKKTNIALLLGLAILKL